jgi:phosphatidate cytidylyltransferase
MTDAQAGDVPAYLVVAGMIVAAHYGSAFQILLALAASFPLIFVFAAARESHDRVTTSMAITFMGILWLGIGLSHAVLLRDLPDHGAALLVDVLVATFIGDTAAYGAGRLFGSRKITPRISPNKTLEGLIGGFIGGTMAFWFAGLYQDWLPGIDALLMGMCVAVLAPIGDLFASMIKRDLAIKDTGTLFGPHGGLIDRLDAVLFTVVGLLPVRCLRLLTGERAQLVQARIGPPKRNFSASVSVSERSGVKRVDSIASCSRSAVAVDDRGNDRADRRRRRDRLRGQVDYLQDARQDARNKVCRSARPRRRRMRSRRLLPRHGNVT